MSKRIHLIFLIVKREGISFLIFLKILKKINFLFWFFLNFRQVRDIAFERIARRRTLRQVSRNGTWTTTTAHSGTKLQKSAWDWTKKFVKLIHYTNAQKEFDKILNIKWLKWPETVTMCKCWNLLGKISWNHFRWIYFWRVLAIWNHSAALENQDVLDLTCPVCNLPVPSNDYTQHIEHCLINADPGAKYLGFFSTRSL